jgi:outer membrane protein, heavy metal efflux system
VKRTFIFWVPIVLIILNTGPCWAQSRLSLREAIGKALASRASLKAEAERVPIAEGLRKQAGLPPNPEFQFQNENLRPSQTYTRDVDTLALINQPLDLLGKRRRRVVLAGEGVIRTQAEYELARWQVAQRVKLAYWAARGAQEIHDILKTTVNNFQKITDYHSAQLSVGAIAEQDFLRVRLDAERARLDAELAWARGMVDYRQSIARLEAAEGLIQ